MTQIWMAVSSVAHHRRWHLALATVAILTLSACTGGDEATNVQPDDRIEELLRWIPDSPDTRAQLYLVNLASLRETGAVSLPEDLTDLQQVITYEQQLRDASALDRFNVEFLGYEAPAEAAHENLIEYLHLGYAHIDLIAEAGVPPARLFLTAGRYDAEAATRSLTACTVCVYRTEISKHEGVTYYAWGEDNAQNIPERNGPPMLDNLGRGGRLVITDQVAVRANQSRSIEWMIEAHERARRSLADLDDFMLAAKTLHEQRVFLSYLTSESQGPDFYDEFISFLDFGDATERMHEAWNPPAGTPILRSYQLFSAGAVVHGDRAQVVIVLIHKSAEDAEANVGLLRRRIEETDSAVTGLPWTEQIESADIKTIGRVLVATIEGLVLWGFHNEGDPLFLHE